MLTKAIFHYLGQYDEMHFYLCFRHNEWIIGRVKDPANVYYIVADPFYDGSMPIDKISQCDILNRDGYQWALEQSQKYLILV